MMAIPATMVENSPETSGTLPGKFERGPWGWLILFASTSTLICCALPIILVMLGMGAVSAAMFSNIPFLTTLAHYKLWLFAGSGLMLLLGGWALYRPGRACPVDPMLAAKCASAHRWNQRLFILSVIIWIAGFTAAFLSVPMLEIYESFSA
ncbi:MAG: hypothetical protein V3V03_04855 [Hyphomonadaceae bacterium]